MGSFDKLDHDTLLKLLRVNIHDGRLIRLIEGLLKAGYLEDWRWNETMSGAPQGGILSPLLSNIYLHELDRFVEETVVPAYTRGKWRSPNPEYRNILRQREADATPGAQGSLPPPHSEDAATADGEYV